MAVPDPVERATVALVSEQLKGFRELMDERTKNWDEKLDTLMGMPAAVQNLDSRMTSGEKRLDALESRNTKTDDRSFDWHRINLPTMVIAGLATIGTFTSIILALTGH